MSCQPYRDPRPARVEVRIVYAWTGNLSPKEALDSAASDLAAALEEGFCLEATAAGDRAFVWTLVRRST